MFQGSFQKLGEPSLLLYASTTPESHHLLQPNYGQIESGEKTHLLLNVTPTPRNHCGVSTHLSLARTRQGASAEFLGLRNQP